MLPTGQTSTKVKKEALYKVMWLGDIGTGKTVILKRATDDVFSENYKNTIGMAISVQMMDFVDVILRLQYWDIAGQERLGTMTKSYYRGAKGAIITWDVTREETFDGVIRWHNDLLTKVRSIDLSEERTTNLRKNFPVTFVANKFDLISGVKEPKEFDFEKWDKSNFEKQANSLFKAVNKYRREQLGEGSELQEIQIYLSSAKWNIAYRVKVTENAIEYSKDRMTIKAMTVDIGKVIDLKNLQFLPAQEETVSASSSPQGYQRYELSSEQMEQLRAHKQYLEARWRITNAARYLGSFFTGWNTGTKIVVIDRLLEDKPAKESVVDDGTLRDIVIDNKKIYQKK